ncbi:MAG: hypothetical protein IPL65_15070 [Lewinellaceae bacterium]|nr:hypothetical protein [Lewinellaceae bacterium]
MNDPLDHNSPADQPQKRPLGKVVMINFGIMILYMLFSSLSTAGGSGSEAGLSSMILDAMLLVLQVGTNLVLGLVLLFTDHKEVASGMLVSALLIGIIGFGACVGKASIF